MPSSARLCSAVGCQSMGCMRSSNSADGLNFHLRMMVQMMIAPPMQDAMTIMTVRVALPIPDDDAELVLAAAADAVGDESLRELVKVTVVGPRLTAAVSLGAEVTARVSWIDEEVEDEEVEVIEEVEVVEVEVVDVDVELSEIVDDVDVLVVLNVVDVVVT